MRTVVISDIHGRSIWRDVVEHSKSEILYGVDKYVFMGDYFDPYDNIDIENLLSNFREILSFQRQDPDKVVLLIGNHEIGYTKYCPERYSRYDSKNAEDIQYALTKAIKNHSLQLSTIWDNVLYTHAGVTKTWLQQEYNGDLQAFIDDCMLKKANADKYFFENHGSPLDFYGNHRGHSPMWVRTRPLIADAVEGVKQVVGHTQLEKVAIRGNLCFTDCLGQKRQYVVVDNGEFIITDF